MHNFTGENINESEDSMAGNISSDNSVDVLTCQSVHKNIISGKGLIIRLFIDMGTKEWVPQYIMHNNLSPYL